MVNERESAKEAATSTSSVLSLAETAVTTALPEYAQVIALYEEAFPPEERFDKDVLLGMASNPAIEFTAYFDEDDNPNESAGRTDDNLDGGPNDSPDARACRTFCGFTYSVVGEHYVYLLFLAVDGTLRRHGYGSQILAQVRAAFPDSIIVLDIEPLDPAAPNYEQRMRRLAFYKRNGYSLTGYDLFEDDMRYTVLSTTAPGEFDPDAFKRTIGAVSHGAFPMELQPTALPSMGFE